MQSNQNRDFLVERLISVINRLMLIIVVLIIGLVSIPFYWIYKKSEAGSAKNEKTVMAEALPEKKNYWAPRDIAEISDTVLKARIEYGKDLIAHTSKYLGPNGTVKKTSNGMNCQNCHLEAGTKVFGNNYGSVSSMYPKFRARSGTVENIYKRVNDCIERSLNGKALDTAGKEMQAIASYIQFIGSNVEKGKKAEGSGFKDLQYLDRAADPVKGKEVYVAKCQSCHQPDGGGQLLPDKSEYAFPPLWGAGSYNDGAGLYRVSNFAKYVKYNMPQGTRHDNPSLTDEEAWDVAAFVNSNARPHLNVPKDWPDKSKKPVDHPFGPYADEFSENQHKFGPFKPIAAAQKKREEQAAAEKKNKS